jgi:prepilin-type N-terminal cleavage/methylation domain-containing protein
MIPSLPIFGSRPPRSALRSDRAFSLVEIMVVISLLSLIVLALMAVFNSTQRAFRASVTQTDVLEGGRSTVDLIMQDLRGMTPSGGSSNVVVPFVYSPVNFFSVANSSYLPLVQSLPGSGMARSNLLNWFFVLGRENTKWIATGYVVDNNDTEALYPLYRYYRADLNVQNDPWMLFTNFTEIVANGRWTNGYMSHLVDGVVHLNVHAFDRNGRWIQNYSVPYYTNALNTFFLTPAYGEPQLYMFSNTVPASVELEMGILEDRAIARAESLPNNLPAPPPLDRRTLYLQGQAGAVHLFRQRVSIPNFDPSAYQ